MNAKNARSWTAGLLVIATLLPGAARAEKPVWEKGAAKLSATIANGVAPSGATFAWTAGYFEIDNGYGMEKTTSSNAVDSPAVRDAMKKAQAGVPKLGMKGAIKFLDAVLEPKDGKFVYTSALPYLTRAKMKRHPSVRDFPGALLDIHYAIMMDNNWLPLYLTLAEIYYDAGKFKEAKGVLGLVIRESNNIGVKLGMSVNKPIFQRIPWGMRYQPYLLMAKTQAQLKNSAEAVRVADLALQRGRLSPGEAQKMPGMKAGELPVQIVGDVLNVMLMAGEIGKACKLGMMIKNVAPNAKQWVEAHCTKAK